MSLINEYKENISRLENTISTGFHHLGYVKNCRDQIEHYKESIAFLQSDEIYRDLSIVNLINYRVPTTYGHLGYNGYALFDTKRNELVEMGDNKPYQPAGGLSALKSIIVDGLIGEPSLYISTQEQRNAIHFVNFTIVEGTCDHTHKGFEIVNQRGSNQ